MENINIEKVIYKWFELKYSVYDKLEDDDSIYYYYKGQDYADIRIDTKSKYIYYRWKLYEEFSEIIYLNFIEFEEFMIKWFEDTFGLKEFTPKNSHQTSVLRLKIPK